MAKTKKPTDIYRWAFRRITAIPNVGISVIYKGYDTGIIYEMDLLIEGEIIFEAKAGEQMHPAFESQIISYLKLADKKPGYLENFNVNRLKEAHNHLTFIPLPKLPYISK